MTSDQKKRIAELRKRGEGYIAIAKKLDVPVNTVKTYCRRNGLTGEYFSEKLSISSQPNDLISVPNRGNSNVPEPPGSLESTGVSTTSPICTVTVSYADEPNESAVADVLDILMNLERGSENR